MTWKCVKKWWTVLILQAGFVGLSWTKPKFKNSHEINLILLIVYVYYVFLHHYCQSCNLEFRFSNLLVANLYNFPENVAI
jgi:hypothetical protein